MGECGMGFTEFPMQNKRIWEFWVLCIPSKVPEGLEHSIST